MGNEQSSVPSSLSTFGNHQEHSVLPTLSTVGNHFEHCKSSGNNIEQEAKLVNDLLTAAKCGNFDRVWEIIGEPGNPKKAHLLNCVPDNRRWGVLHQAVFWRRPEVLKKLLSFQACDSDMRAKRCTSECGDTSGMCALEIASAYKYEDMRLILASHSNRILQQEIPTFQHGSYLGLICNTLAAYKSTFHPGYVSSDLSVFEVLRKVFNDIERDNARYEAVKKQVCDAMHIVSIENAKLIDGASSREDFYKFIVKAYTIEKHYLYTYISTALRRQKSSKYCPTGDDLALGPYATMYQMLLLFWDKLIKETGTTYRQMKMKQEDIDKYKEGVEFYWPAVVSSTTVQTKAQSFPTCEKVSGDKTVLFIIDNSASSDWSPKDIEKYARYEENERTYPAGSKFRVISSMKKSYPDITEVKLRLLAQP